MVPMKRRTLRNAALSCFLFALMVTGCTKEVDSVVVPLTQELNATLAHTEVEVLPDTTLRLKGSGVCLEKNF